MFTDHPRDWVHAAIVEAIIASFGQADGETMPESSYNYYGQRGAVDIARFSPTCANGCRLDVFEIETRLFDIDVNRIIRKVRDRGLLFPLYLKVFKELEVGQVYSWLAMLPTQENAELVIEYQHTFVSLFGAGTREPRADGVRYGLCLIDPLAFKGIRALPLHRLQHEGILDATLLDLCCYRDKPEVERALHRARTVERQLSRAG